MLGVSSLQAAALERSMPSFSLFPQQSVQPPSVHAQHQKQVLSEAEARAYFFAGLQAGQKQEQQQQHDFSRQPIYLLQQQQQHFQPVLQTTVTRHQQPVPSTKSSAVSPQVVQVDFPPVVPSAAFPPEAFAVPDSTLGHAVDTRSQPVAHFVPTLLPSTSNGSSRVHPILVALGHSANIPESTTAASGSGSATPTTFFLESDKTLSTTTAVSGGIKNSDAALAALASAKPTKGVGSSVPFLAPSQTMRKRG